MKQFRFRKILVGLLLNVFWLTSCTATHPIEPQAWQAQPVLITLFTSTNYTYRYELEWSKLPDLVLYADGTLISVHDNSERIIYEAHLQPAEVCSLLNQVATDEFLTLSQKDYIGPKITDSYTIWIRVNAWQNNEIAADGLTNLLEDKLKSTSVSPALKAAYQHLQNYAPANMQEFKPEKLVITALPLDKTETAPTWPFQKPSLADPSLHGWNSVTLENQEATDVYQLFSRKIFQTYNEGGKSYRVTIQPLLPFEIWKADRKWTEPPTFESTPTTELKCAGS